MTDSGREQYEWAEKILRVSQLLSECSLRSMLTSEELEDISVLRDATYPSRGVSDDDIGKAIYRSDLGKVSQIMNRCPILLRFMEIVAEELHSINNYD